ncbi:hypothetical protein U1Q18_004704 [Sarracenia purpurea var. burkii]
MEGEETVNGVVCLGREFEDCTNKCGEWEERRSKEHEERCTMLKLEIEKRKSEYQLLEGKFSALEVEKIGIEDEIKVLKRRNVELEKRIARFEKENNVICEERGMGNVVDLTEENDEEDKVIQLMIENKVLECEKKAAESEVEVWKLKCGELELRVLELEKEKSVLRGGGQYQLAGMKISQPEIDRKQTALASDLEDGLDVINCSTENEMVTNNETTCAAVGVSSTWCSSLKGIEDLQAAGIPLIDMPSKQFEQVKGRKRDFVFETRKDDGSRVRKQLTFGEEGSLSKKLAPSTPGIGRPFSSCIIDIDDSEDELDNSNLHMPHFECPVNRMAQMDFLPGDTFYNEIKKGSDKNLKRTLLDQSDEEDMNGYTGNFPFISTPKRRRASNIVTTDSEGGDDDDDDNVPISKLMSKHRGERNRDVVDCCLNSLPVTATVSEEKLRESSTPRRRLVPLRNWNVKNDPELTLPSNINNNGANFHSRIPTNEGAENDEWEEDGSESDTEGESLGGFIVKSSDVSGSDDGSSASEDVSDDNANFDEVISRIRRSREHKVNWEFEADMLAAFGKDLELCMKAVCALYRQQTTDEKFSKGTLYSNQRGFSQCDALRGTTLAEFLTDGDPKGDVNKSVEELREYDPKGPELCRKLATHYSKQLFAIYKNKEDPLFLPS